MASAAMDILLVGLKMTFQLILCRMYNTVQALVEYVTQAPQRIVWNILVCAVVLLACMLRRRYRLKEKRQVAKRCAAQLEEPHGFTQDITQTQTCEAPISPPEGARPLKLQALCLAMLHEITNRFCPLLEYLLKEQNGELPELSLHELRMVCADVQWRLLEESSNSLQVQGAETKTILEASQKDISQADKDMLDDLVTLADAKENIPLLSQGAAKCTEGAQERGGAEQPACVKIEIPE